MLSIISPVLDSHEVVRRQILHYEHLNLPRNVEIILVDDGSNPPLEAPNCKLKNFTILPTHDTRPWTEHIARNAGARIAKGTYLLMIDIDHIISEEALQQMLLFNGDRMEFNRRLGILDENGMLKFDIDTLRKFRVSKDYINSQFIPGHRSQFLIRRDLFWDIGGYREDLWGKAHPVGGGAGQAFWNRIRILNRRGKICVSELKSTIFMFPIGKYCKAGYNPFGLFHNLKK